MMEETDNKENDADWQLRSSLIKEDDTNEWKHRRAAPLSDLQKLAKKVTFQEKGYRFYDEGQTRIMASLVPDEIIYNIDNYSKREFSGCLLFGDVSGFTDLCEKYNKSGKGGPSRLTQVLNNYIGAMVQEILSHGGDVLHFSGDAFIALWKVTDRLSMRDAVHEALDCSLVIQKSYGTYQTDIDVVVRVKLAVASGSLVFSLLGNEETSHYIMTGQPIVDIKAAELKSLAGEIVVTPRVTCHVNANEYLMNILPDGLHAKVLGVGPNWRNIQRQYDPKESRSLLTIYDDESDPFQSKTSLMAFQAGMTEEEADIAARVVSDQYALRPAVNHADRLKLKNALRKFIIPPVMRGIDAEEPLEYLTEMRQVTILFINCKVAPVDPMETIDVANKVYICVCNVVKDKFGSVNKINNFDKDLMLLVIFGLRGFKHELETQIALQCATKCYEKISNMEHVQGVSASVTRGKTYCGVFGYSLRREYTVIGIIVNKGARLMVEYPNKVTCDRDTFLHSKLEASHFILQNYKPLKGIVNPGPIYEFKEMESPYDLASAVSPLPLLGREQELDLFISQLKHATKRSKVKTKGTVFCNMLIFQGYFRQGKTRFLEEMLYCVDSKTPTNTFSLTKYDQESSYKTIREIFSHFIGLTTNTSKTRRKDKIMSRLKGRNVSDYWVLNDVFGVDFQVKRSLDIEMQYTLLSEIFVLLCYGCFVNFWVILIDDAEFIDHESWMLLQMLLDLNLTFIVATMGIQEISTYVIEVLKHEKIQIVNLKPIDKWYHAGLACQMLDIEGIPPELEKTIQLRSDGNPGWIESFLVTLMQSGGLCVEDIKRIHAYKMGLVLPPLYMLMRLSQDEYILWKKIMEEQVYFKDTEMARRWEMFLDSCRESYPDLTVAKKFSRELRKSKLVSICTLNPNFNLNDVEPELYIDVVILKTFDSLTSYEQLLLKCSAVLGDVFPRDMLLYIMSASATRLTALAVQKLFEIHVLSCARGDFIDGGLNFRARLINPNADLTVKCECTGLSVDETCADLPKYASCGYLRFRSSEFRETTYNLLTDNQKREFHTRAIRYLEKETRKCRACGYGYFLKHTIIAGGLLDNGLRTRKMSTKMNKSVVSLIAENSKAYNVEKIYDRSSMSSQSATKVRTLGFSMSKGESISNSSTESMSLGELAIFPASNQLGLSIIRKMRNKFNLTKTFSSHDYSQCTCFLILDTMFAQLIEHCKGAGLVEKIMNATVEYSYVCFQGCNEIQAIKVLEEALLLLEGPMKDQIELEWMVSLKRGKLLSLLGRARLYLDDDEAYAYLINALDCYGIKFPKTQISQHTMKHRYKLKQYIRLYLFPNLFSTKGDEDVASYTNNVSECLSFLCTYFRKKEMWKEAELAALWSLSEVVKTETDFEKMCIAYSNLIYVLTNKSQHNFCVALEVYALTMCHRKMSNVEYEELKAVALLYFSICRARMNMAKVTLSLVEYINYVGGNVNERCVIEGEVVLNAGLIILHGRTDCSSSHIQLVAICLQTSALQSEPHQISGELTILDGSAKIKSTACSCKAGAGKHCKHILAFLILLTRFCRAELDKAMQVGYILLRMSTSSHSTVLLLKVLPTMAYLNLLKRQILEYSNILQEIWYYCEMDTDNTEKGWYYSMCLAMHLELGFAIMPMSKCYKALQAGCLGQIIRDPESKLRYIALMWLWEIRNENWEAAMVWQDYTFNYDVRDITTVPHLITGLHVLEGHIIYMVNKMDMKNLKAAKTADDFICSLFKKYKKSAHFCQLIRPRLYHLMGYYQLVRYNDFKRCFRYLSLAKRTAEKQHNDLELMWIKHNEQAWSNKLSREDKYFWRNHCDDENCIDYRDYDVVVKCLPYSLPLQLYI